MRRIGPVKGGPPAVFTALVDAVGSGSTIVVPAQTAKNSFTSPSHRAATAGLNSREVTAYVQAMPGFDRARSRSQGMGEFVEYVRQRRDAVRSAHPQTSFAAVGPMARQWMGGHRLTSHLGEGSSLARLYEAHGFVLLLGVGFDKCTAFHLAEYRTRWSPRPPTIEYQCFINVNGDRQRVRFWDRRLDSSDFAEIGAALRRDSSVVDGPVGQAVATAFPLRDAVDFAIRWMDAHRPHRRPPGG
jgi:aminoglycoside 3-N-acetyltransferase